MFYAGLDLGQAQDYTALVAVQQVAPRHFHTVGIKRYPLGTPYPVIVEDVCAIRSATLEHAPLIIDGTGVGRAVVDLFRSKLYRAAVPVQITAGGAAQQAEDGYWHVPKRDLIGAVQVSLQQERLKFDAMHPEAQAQVKELENYQVKITAAANDVYNAREGQHDDLVLALALAVWYPLYGRGRASALVQGVARGWYAR
jgi:hypothetical protein